MKKVKKAILLVIFILVSIFIYILVNNKKDVSTNINNKDIKSIDINFGEQVYTYNSYIYIYGKSRIKILKNNDVLLEDKFSFENPKIVTSFDKLAICDVNNKVAKVYSSSGHMYTVNSSNNILGFSINKNGVLAIIFKVGDNYQIEVYYNGDKLYSINNINYDEGVPVSVSVSNDNKILAISYIKSKGATIDSNIVFHSMESNKVFGGVIKENQIVGIIKFSDKNNLIGISDREIFITDINGNLSSGQVKEIYKKDLSNILKYINFLDGIGYVIGYGKSIDSENNPISENTVIFYNQSGGEMGRYDDANKNIENIYSNKYGAILKNSRTFTGISTSGRKLWTYQATQDIQDINYFNDEQVIITTNDKIKIVKLNKNTIDIGINEDTSQKVEETSTEKTSGKEKTLNKNTEEKNKKIDKNIEEDTTKNNDAKAETKEAK